MSDEADQPAVALSNRQELPVDEEGLRDLARRTLAGEGVRAGELSVSLVTIEEMADLHRRYLGIPGPTDVLSFAQDQEAPVGDEPRLLGDVVICPEMAARSREDLAAEMRLLVVHGILHLMGYDHEEEEDRAEMWDRQESYAGVRP